MTRDISHALKPVGVCVYMCVCVGGGGGGGGVTDYVV